MGRNVVLKTGAEREVSDAEYATLSAAGLIKSDIATEDMASRAQATERNIHDTEGDPLGRIATFGLGAANALTGGGTTASARLLGNQAVPGLAEENPITFGLGEAAGTIAGVAMGAKGGAAAGGLPGLASAAGLRTAGRLGGSRLARVAGGAVEGAIGGVGAAVTHASVSDDPLTIESAIADVGLGAILNAGFGALGRGITRTGERVAVKVAREDAEIAAREALESAGPAYSVARTELKAIRSQAKAMARETEEAVAKARVALDDAPKAAAESIRNAAAANAERIGVIARAEGAAATGGGPGGVPRIISKAQSAKAEIDKLLAAGDLDGAAAKANALGEQAHAGHIRVGDIEGLGPAPEGGYRVPTATEHVAKAQEALQAAEAAASSPTKVIPKLPKTMDEFARIQPSTVASLDAAIAADSTGAARKSLDALAESLGVVVQEGETPLAAIHAHVRAAASLDGAAGMAKKGRRGWLARGVRRGVQRVADRAAGGGMPGAILGSGAGMLVGGIPGALVAAEVTGARHAIQSRITRAIAAIAPKTGRAIQKASPALARFFNGPDGKPEKGKPHEIALRRIDETARLAVAAPDASYEAVRHVIPAGVDAAAAIQHKSIAVANYLASVMPKDPGTAQAQFKSFWKPSNEQIQKFADQHLAATDPMAAIEYLAEGNVNTTMATALRQNWPALFERFRREFIQALPSKGPMPHGQLMAYSVMLDTPLHGLQSPENIAYFQTEVHGPKAEAPEPTMPKTFTPGAPPARSTTGSAQPAMTQAQRLQNR